MDVPCRLWVKQPQHALHRELLALHLGFSVQRKTELPYAGTCEAFNQTDMLFGGPRSRSMLSIESCLPCTWGADLCRTVVRRIRNVMRALMNVLCLHRAN